MSKIKQRFEEPPFTDWPTSGTNWLDTRQEWRQLRADALSHYQGHADASPRGVLASRILDLEDQLGEDPNAEWGDCKRLLAEARAAHRRHEWETCQVLLQRLALRITP